jgi:transposase
MSIHWKSLCETDSEREAALYLHKMYRKGLTTPQIAHSLNVSDPSVLNLFRKYGLKTKRWGGRSHRHGALHVSEEEYCEMTIKEIMKKYGMSASSVWRLTKKYPRKSKRQSPAGAG